MRLEVNHLFSFYTHARNRYSYSGTPPTNLITDELRGIFQIHLLLGNGVINGGQAETTQRVAPCAVAADDFHNFSLECGGHGDLVGADAHMRAPVENALRGALSEHPHRLTGSDRFARLDHHRHRFPIAREFKSELFFPHACEGEVFAKNKWHIVFFFTYEMTRFNGLPAIKATIYTLS